LVSFELSQEKGLPQKEGTIVNSSTNGRNKILKKVGSGSYMWCILVNSSLTKSLSSLNSDHFSIFGQHDMSELKPFTLPQIILTIYLKVGLVKSIT